MFSFQSMAQKVPFGVKEEGEVLADNTLKQVEEQMAPIVASELLAQMKDQYPDQEITKELEQAQKDGNIVAFFRLGVGDEKANAMIRKAFGKAAQGLEKKDIERLWKKFNMYLTNTMQQLNRQREKHNQEFLTQEMFSGHRRREDEKKTVKNKDE